MYFHIVSLFPEACESYIGSSIIKRAIEDKKLKVSFYNPKEYSDAKLKKADTYAARRIDDKPYGGGPGMVVEAIPVIRCIEKAKGKKKKVKIVYFSPTGTQFTNETAKQWAHEYSDIVLVSGRYEGIDSRVQEIFPGEDVTVGPYVLTGGELPALIVLDTVSRQVEGVLGDFTSLEESRISSPKTYTRPASFTYKKKKYSVPEVLVNGNHKEIDKWRKEQRG